MPAPQYFLDTNILVYSIGADEVYRPACERIMEAIATDVISAAVSTEVLQEVVYRYHAIRKLAEGLALARDVVSIVPVILPVALADIEDMLHLVAQHSRLSPRDALHAAVARRAGITQILTADQDFTGVIGLTRVDPLDLAREL